MWLSACRNSWRGVVGRSVAREGVIYNLCIKSRKVHIFIAKPEWAMASFLSPAPSYASAGDPQPIQYTIGGSRGQGGSSLPGIFWAPHGSFEPPSLLLDLLGAVCKRHPHKIAKNWPPLPLPVNVCTGSIPLSVRTHQKFQKIWIFFAPKSADVRIWRRPLHLVHKMSELDKPSPPDCGLFYG